MDLQPIAVWWSIAIAKALAELFKWAKENPGAKAVAWCST